ncbi:MAG: cation:proton antiporter [Bacteroidales bacterium]|nr:cation:proton antiporter [Bacteroidales bacterium]
MLAIFLLSSLFAKLAGIEAIVGAFLSGLALNRVIPHNSALMDRITFIGNTLFIPFFLIGVGMLINLKVLFLGLDGILFALVMIIIALISKYLAAYFTQIIYRFPKLDRNLIFGLSASHAAATIAVVLVGYDLNILSETALNATILIILVSCSVSSFITENSGRKIVLLEPEIPELQKNEAENILVPISNPISVGKILEFAILSRQSKSSVIYPLSVVQDDEHVEKSLQYNKDFINKITGNLAKTDADIRPITRIDINIPTGIYRTMKELRVKKLLLGLERENKYG